MLRDLEQQFSLLENSIIRLKKDYRQLRNEHAELSGLYENMKQKYDDERKKNQELAEEYKNIKMQAALSGNPEHNRLMKNHINRLVKEVDACIAQLQNTGM